jgi:hypothetical protein
MEAEAASRAREAFGPAATTVPLRTWYRVMRGGTMWCETSDPDEAVAAARPSDQLERLQAWAVTVPWQAWDPKEQKQ